MARSLQPWDAMPAMPAPTFHLSEPCLDYLRLVCEERVEVLDVGARDLAERVADRLDARGEDPGLAESLRRAVSRSDSAQRDSPNPTTVLSTSIGDHWRDAANELAPGSRLILIGATCELSRDSVRRAALSLNQSDVRFALKSWSPTPDVDACQLFEMKRLARLPRVVLLPDPADAPAQIRTLGPFEELERRGQIRLTVLGNDHTAALRNADLLVLQRFGGLPAFHLQCQARRLGIPVALDLDDDFFSIPWFNPSAASFARLDKRVLLSALLRGADQLFVSTPALADAMRAFNDRIVVTHNLVDTEQFTSVTSFRESDSDDEVVTFGYIGTNTHLEDLRPVLSPLRELVESSGGKVRAVFIGGLPTEFARLPYVEYKGWFNSYRSAAAALSRSKVNVALAPLLDLTFNRSKSAMKFLEYGACGIPGLFSDVGAFRDHIRHLENGYLVGEHSAEAWGDALRFIVENPTSRRRMAQNAYRDVCANHSIRSQLDRFFRPYRDLIEQSGERGLDLRPGMPPSLAEETVRVGGASAPELSVVLRVSPTLETALAELLRVREAVADDAQLIVVSRSENLCRMLALSGEVQVIFDDPHRDTDASPVSQAMKRARGQWVLWISAASSEFTYRQVQQILTHRADGVLAVGPTVVDPIHPQGVHRAVSHDAAQPTSLHAAAQAMRQSSSGSVEPIPFLGSDFVLIQRERALELLDKGTCWDDVLTGMCLSAQKSDLKVLVANDVIVKRRPERMPSSPTLVARAQKSRSRLWARHQATLLAVVPKEQAGAREIQGHRFRLATVEPGRFAVWILAREKSPYLDECVRRLVESSAIPSALNIWTESDDRVAQSVGDHWGARVKTSSYSAPGSLRRMLLEDGGASHALVLHDGVMLTPDSIRELLFAAMVGDRPFTIPMSNDGAPSQLAPHEPGDVGFCELDSVAERVVGLARGTAIETTETGETGSSTVLVHLDAFRRMLDRGHAPGKATTAVAKGAYVRVLSHPSKLGPWGQWVYPGGPFDQSAIALSECQRLEREGGTDGVLRQLKVLLAAHRNNRFDARVLAKLGGLLVLNGEPERGMSWIDNASRVDPFCSEVKNLDRHLRSHLGLMCQPPPKPSVVLRPQKESHHVSLR